MISLCMITLNESPRLQRAIDSARSQVEELIIVDTGSTDGTIDIARDNMATVARIPFVDFSHARNYSISLAHGDYIFVLDADETLEGELPVPHVKHSYAFHRVNVGPDYRACDDYPVRLFPRSACYEGRVHETVNASVARNGGSIRSVANAIRHWLPTQGERKAKNLRYIEVLRQEIAESPNMERMEFLAAEYYQMGEFQQAAAVAQGIVDRWPGNGRWHQRARRYREAVAA